MITKKFKLFIENVAGIILFQIILMIPIVNVIFTFQYGKQTLNKWLDYKSILHRIHNSDRIAVTVANGKEHLVVFDDSLLALEFCRDKKTRLIRNAEIKYVVIEDGHLVIRLWNNRKLNKYFGIED